jgi:hypothetical protein
MRWNTFCGSFDRRRVALVTATMACAATALALSSCANNFDQLTRVSETFPQAKVCGECHVEIYREWSESPHAGSFTNPQYRAATDNYQFNDCLSCHAPQPGLAEAEPEARMAHREEGVTCVTCHLAEGQLSGPLQPTGQVAPHPVTVAGDRYHSSQFCGRCHQGTLREWQAVEKPDKPDCQRCHMPQTTRKITQPTGPLSALIVGLEKEVKQRRHLFDRPDAKPEHPHMTFSAARENGGLELTVTNLLPHALPTGDFGLRIVVLEVEALKSDGTGVPLPPHELVKELGTALPAGASRTFKLAPPDGTRALRARLVRKGQGGAADSVLIDCEVPLP